MPEYIGRIRSENVWNRWLEERKRAYRFPRLVAAYQVLYYVPNLEHGMCEAWLSRAHKKNRAWYQRVHEMSTLLTELDIKRIDVRYRSPIMRIELVSGPHIIDYRNRWDRIESIFSDTFSLPILDYSHPRFVW